MYIEYQKYKINHLKLDHIHTTSKLLLEFLFPLKKIFRAHKYIRHLVNGCLITQKYKHKHINVFPVIQINEYCF